jgi:Tfp pilus assembly PilM family ATPase
MAKTIDLESPTLLSKLKGSGKSHLAIDLGTSSIKILELRTTPKGTDIVHHAMAPTPPGGFQAPVLAAQIKEMLQENRIKTKQAVVGLAGQGVAARRLSLPNIPKRKSKRRFAGRPGSFFPFPWEMH